MARDWLGNLSQPWQTLAKIDDHDISLFEASLLAARDAYPALDTAQYLDEFDNHVAQLRRRLDKTASSVDSLRLLNQYLFNDAGFAGNFFDYYDPRNSYINEVLDRKLGIPITLSLLYIEIGRKLGIDVDGVAFPGHFLVRMPVDNGLIILDPFHGGKSVGLDELKLRARNTLGEELPDDQQLRRMLKPSSNRSVLTRLLSNLLQIYQQRDDMTQALQVCDRLFTVAPTVDTLRTRGEIYLGLEAYGQAATDFERYLRVAKEPDDLLEVRQMMIDAKQKAPRAH